MCIYCDVMDIIEGQLKDAEVGEVCLVRLKGMGLYEEDIDSILDIMSIRRGLEARYSAFVEDLFVVVHKVDEPAVTYQ